MKSVKRQWTQLPLPGFSMTSEYLLQENTKSEELGQILINKETLVKGENIQEWRTLGKYTTSD